MIKKVVIWGVGRYGSTLLSVLRRDNRYSCIAFTDSGPSPAAVTANIANVPYVHSSEMHLIEFDLLVVASNYANEIVSFIVRRNLVSREKLFICEDYDRLQRRIAEHDFRGPTKVVEGNPESTPDSRARLNFDDVVSPLEVRDFFMTASRYYDDTTLRKTLFFPYYTPPCGTRQKEIEAALLHNLGNTEFSEVFICCEDSNQPAISSSFPHARVLRGLGRMSYALWLSLSKHYCRREGVSLLVNSDIFFHQGDVGLIDRLFKSSRICSKTLFALSRHEYIDGKYFFTISPRYTQDAWVMLVANMPDEECLGWDEFRISLGTPRCDNRFARLCYDRGYEVVNLGRELRIFHIHDSHYRSYKIGDNHANLGPLLFVDAAELGDIRSAINAVRAIEVDSLIKFVSEG
jgi:hypothetical protein